MSEVKEQKKEMVGAYVPNQLYQALNLYTLLHGKSKTQIILDGLLRWQEQEGVEIEDLIEEMAITYRQDYKDLQVKEKTSGLPVDSQTPEDQFVDDYRIYLSNKNVPEKVINEIFKQF
jgi:hypothetical protein